MKYAVALFLGAVQGIENTETNETENERAVWVAADNKYVLSSEKSCTLSTDCAADHVCVTHAWAYNDQYESAKGCWHKSVCAGNASFWMFDERKIQFFCDTSATDKIDGDFGELTYPITVSETEHWTEARDACTTHGDCILASEKDGQRCTEILWDVSEDGSAWTVGKACYTWDEEVCGAGETFSVVNENYENT